MLINFSQGGLLQCYLLEVQHAESFISQWFREGVEEGMLGIDIIHAIEIVESS